jgi:ADP-dependent NAD(P)H-hydrate dehydratase / NAD(P)H-hydrate epimerase
VPQQRQEYWRAFSSAEVRDVVAQVLATGVDHDALIRRAAAGLATVCAEELRERCGSVYGRRVLLFVGTGNNGADVLFAGARLRRRGVQVDALLIGSRAYQPALRAFAAAGGRVVQAPPAGDYDANEKILADLLDDADLLVDGIVGDRGRGGLTGIADELAGLLDGFPHIPLVAADLPSGVDPDTGELPGSHLTADVTVTFGEAKPCLLLPPACHVAGRLVLVDVGLPRLDIMKRAVQRWGSDSVASDWPVPEYSDHKYSRGVLGVVAGSDEYPGAAVLSCLGAMRAGVGMVRYIGPQRATDHVLLSTPEVVQGSGRVQAWLLGPGIEPGTHQNGAIASALDSDLPCVVDAGALAACAHRRSRGEHAAAADDVLLTPHAGELAALLTLLGHAVQRSDVEARPLWHARRLAQEADATVLLKGSTTLIVGPSGSVAAEQTGPPWLATAGAGDVLAGIAGALMAGGVGAFFAGDMAAVVHGLAAARASNGGPISATAVAAAVPATLAEILPKPDW